MSTDDDDRKIVFIGKTSCITHDHHHHLLFNLARQRDKSNGFLFFGASRRVATIKSNVTSCSQQRDQEVVFVVIFVKAVWQPIETITFVYDNNRKIE